VDGLPDEIANAVAFLVSPHPSFITGAALVANGALAAGVCLAGR
jgi:NAD(P)-dependent dehydrogenase (short-subunit alcohol dehydrogenase family)